MRSGSVARAGLGRVPGPRASSTLESRPAHKQSPRAPRWARAAVQRATPARAGGEAKAHRVLGPCLLLGLAALVAPTPAGACGASAWVFNPEELPPCVEVFDDGTGTYDLTNGCSTTLRLELRECSDCLAPPSVDPGASAPIELPESPGRHRLVPLDWSADEQAGSAKLEYLFSDCSFDEGCSAATPRSDMSSMALLLPVAACLLGWRARTRRLSRPRRRPDPAQ